MDTAANVSVACRSCSQVLVVPTTNLQASFACPRCGVVSAGADLIPATTPLPAVAIEATPSPLVAVSATGLPIVDGTAVDTRPNFSTLSGIGACEPPGTAPPVAMIAHAEAPTPKAPVASTTVPGLGAAAPGAPAAAGPSHPTEHEAVGTAQAAMQVALSNAASVGRVGIQGVGHLGGWILGLAEWVDVKLHGYRGLTVLLIAIVAAAVGVLEWWTERAPVFTVVATFALILGLEILALARLGSLRDDAGGWSGALVLRRLLGVLGDVRDSAGEFLQMATGLKLQVAGRSVMVFGLAALLLRNVFVGLARAATLVGFELAQDLEHWSGYALLFGLLGVFGGGGFWALGWRKLHDDAKLGDLEVDPSQRDRISQVSRALPPVIDCSDKPAMAALARDVNHPLLRETLRALEAWQPRVHRYEDDYQRLLFRHIRQRIPAARPEREKPVLDPVTGKPGRADLVVGDTVLIEMKLDLSAGSVQRAITQIAQYSRSWSRGPVLLLVCAADVDTARRRFGYELEEMHRKAPVSLVVAAGTRR